VEDQSIDLLTTETLGVGSRQYVDALTKRDFEIDLEEVGAEDRHPATIVNFCRKAIGIYDFQLTFE
jgi:hypothetical protein